MIWAALPHRNREHQPTVRCAVYIYLSLRRLGLEKVVSLRQRDMSSRSGRRYAGRQGGGTLGGPCAPRREARGARVRTASRNYRTNVANYADSRTGINASRPCAVMTSFRLTTQRRHASWLPLRKLILHSILGTVIPMPVPRTTGASQAPGTATIGDGALRVPSESPGVVAIPVAPRVG